MAEDRVLGPNLTIVDLLTDIFAMFCLQLSIHSLDSISNVAESGGLEVYGEGQDVRMG